MQNSGCPPVSPIPVSPIPGLPIPVLPIPVSPIITRWPIPDNSYRWLDPIIRVLGTRLDRIIRVRLLLGS